MVRQCPGDAEREQGGSKNHRETGEERHSIRPAVVDSRDLGPQEEEEHWIQHPLRGSGPDFDGAFERGSQTLGRPRLLLQQDEAN
mmetsp:Transcript_49725/g.50114  ORF Transcript_49725/g.50114 Transcript_49725/m.50114 type:complete len:85 (-) Transcript_49725:118-372(-)